MLLYEAGSLSEGATENECSVFQVTRIFCYLTVVTLQYLVPIFLILFSTLALKALGKWNTLTAIVSTTAFEKRMLNPFLNYLNAELED